MVCSEDIISSKTIAAASPIRMPVLTNKSIKAASRIYSFKANGERVESSISKHFRILPISVIESVLGNFLSCLNLNFSFLKGELSITSLSIR